MVQPLSGLRSSVQAQVQDQGTVWRIVRSMRKALSIFSPSSLSLKKNKKKHILRFPHPVVPLDARHADSSLFLLSPSRSLILCPPFFFLLWRGVFSRCMVSPPTVIFSFFFAQSTNMSSWMKVPRPNMHSRKKNDVDQAPPSIQSWMMRSGLQARKRRTSLRHTAQPPHVFLCVIVGCISK